VEYSKKRVVKKIIPDNDPNGLVDIIRVSRDLTVKEVSLTCNIDHPYSGDLSIELHGPHGKKKTIQSPSRSPGKNLNKTFSGELTAVFEGIKSRGEWILKVLDNGAKDVGTLNDWTLNLTLANSKKSEIIIDDHSVLKSVQVCHQGYNISQINAKVNIEHAHVGDLKIDLISPSGTSVTLHNKSGGANNTILKSFDSSDLKPFLGESAKGKWTLVITDSLKGDSGKLLSWGLDIKTLKK